MNDEWHEANKKSIMEYIESGDIWRYNALRFFVDEPRRGDEVLSFFERSGGIGIGGGAPGSVYPYLRQLIGEGYLELCLSGRNRVYSITDEGRDFLKGVPRSRIEETFQALMDNWNERNRIDACLAALEDAIHVLIGKERDGTPVVKILADATAAVSSLAS